MGEALRGSPEAPAVVAAGSEGAPASIGAYLARQRRLRGISLDDLELSTRIPRRSLERLEAGAFDHDRDAFARSFVKTVAQALGLDANETLARMLEEERPDAVRARGALRASRPLALALALLVIVGGALVLWRGAPALRAWRPLAGEDREIVQRRDPVHALADEARLRKLTAPPPWAPRTGPAPRDD
jgi:hypothetical protein